MFIVVNNCSTGRNSTDHRSYLSLFECYKFVFRYYHLNFYDFFELSKVGSTRANHPFEYNVKSARLDICKYSFLIRIVSKWNDLPRVIVEAERIHHFKNKLHHYLFNKF